MVEYGCGHSSIGTKVSSYTYEYDGSGFITKEKVDDSSQIDVVGFFSWLWSLIFKNNVDTKYTYDARGQLAQAEQKTHRIFKWSNTITTYYTYDGAGNRLTKYIVGKKIDNIKENYTYNDADQLTQLSRTIKNKTEKINFNYDKNGNLVKSSQKDFLCKDERTYTYNNENRLTAVKDNGRLMMAALYGGDGERLFTVNYMHETDYRSSYGGTLAQMNIQTLAKDRVVEYDSKLIKDEMLIPNGVKPISYGLYELTGYVNDTNREHSQVLLEYGAEERITNYFEYGAAGRNSISGMRGKYFYDYDGRGSVVGLTRNDTGLSDVFYSYNDSGSATRKGAGVLANPYTYNGEYTDLSVGMQYLRAREYDPGTGRFTSKDTYLGRADDPITRNLYTYVGNNPVNRQDPSGHGWIGDAWNATTKFVSDVGNGIKNAAVSAYNWAGDRVNDVVNAGKWLGGKIVDGAKWVGDKLVSGAKWVGGKIADAAKATGKWLGNQFNAAKKKFEEIRKKLCDTASKIGNQVVDFAKNAFDAYVETKVTQTTMDTGELYTLFGIVTVGHKQTVSGVISEDTDAWLVSVRAISEAIDDDLSYGVGLDLLYFLGAEVYVDTNASLGAKLNLNLGPNTTLHLDAEISLFGNGSLPLNATVAIGVQTKTDKGEVDNTYYLSGNVAAVMMAAFAIYKLYAMGDPSGFTQPAYR